MGPIGMQEMIALFVIALLLFGPKKLPELGKTLGKALSEFRRAKSELKATFESHMNEIERETRLETSTPSTSYSYPYDDCGQQDYSYGSSTTDQISSAQPAGELPAPATETSPNGSPTQAASHAPAHTPVADTVARVNGVQPISVPVEKDHRD
ncbi:MAG: twin-arginine translocase TatA/TatE family subunit [Bryobacteraceae bacterium]